MVISEYFFPEHTLWCLDPFDQDTILVLDHLHQLYDKTIQNFTKFGTFYKTICDMNVNPITKLYPVK